MLHALISRLRDAGPTAGPAVGTRLEVCPPPDAADTAGWRQRCREWWAAWGGSRPLDIDLLDSSDDDDSGHGTPLWTVRGEFVDSFADVPGPAALRLRQRVRLARSLLELWHLRPEVFDLISRHRDQAHADRCLARLNRHFPTRSPRSGFGAFDALVHVASRGPAGATSHEAGA